MTGTFQYILIYKFLSMILCKMTIIVSMWHILVKTSLRSNFPLFYSEFCKTPNFFIQIIIISQN